MLLNHRHEIVNTEEFRSDETRKRLHHSSERNTNEGCEFLDDALRIMDLPGSGPGKVIFEKPKD